MSEEQDLSRFDDWLKSTWEAAGDDEHPGELTTARKRVAKRNAKLLANRFDWQAHAKDFLSSMTDSDRDQRCLLAQTGLIKSIMVAALDDDQALALYRVDQAVFAIDTARPETCERVLQGFWLAQTRVRAA